MVYRTKWIALITMAVVMMSCESPDSLKPVSGLEGELSFTGSWPDSLKAAALVILSPGVMYDEDNIGNYLLSYTNPIHQTSDFFVQLPPGSYIGVVVGLLVDPGLFVANLDYYLEQPELPIIPLSEPIQGSMLIREGEISTKNWTVDFN